MRVKRLVRDADGGAEVAVSVSTAEDVWCLYNLIVGGDAIRTRTARKIVHETATGTTGSERRVLELTIRVASIEFDATNGELRLGGVVSEECAWVKLGSHHTLAISAGDPQNVTVVKQVWDSVAQDLLQDAVSATERMADAAAVVMDYGIANVCLLTPSMVITKARITHPIAKKRRGAPVSRDDSVEAFFKSVVDALLAHVDWESARVVLVCSPSNVRDDFVAFLRKTATAADGSSNNPRTVALRRVAKSLGKIMTVRVSSGYTFSLREALKDRNVMAQMNDSHVAQCTSAWASFLAAMTKTPELCAYTSQFVYVAVTSGAVQTIFIADSQFHTSDHARRAFFVGMAEVARQFGGTVLIVSSMAPAGSQLQQLGGVAAILRYELAELDELEADPAFPSREVLKEMHTASLSRGGSSMESSRTRSF